MFKVTWVNYGELDFESSNFCEIVYSVFSHNIFYETCNGIRHVLCCDFGSIFDELRTIVSSEEFQSEVPDEDGCDGDWYLFEYILNDEVVKHTGYIDGLEQHEKIVSLIKSCAKSILDNERKLLEHKCTDDEMQAIIKQRQELDADFFKIWENTVSKTVSIPDGFIKCANCNSIVHNKYYKNRKYWGRVWLSGEFGDYEVEYDSGECPVCGQLNTELPDTGLEFQPDEDLLENNNKDFTIEHDENSNKLYTFDELNYLLKHLSDEDRIKVSDCQFKLDEQYPDDDSGDVYDYLTVYRNNNEVGKIDMQYHSNTYFDLIDREIKTTDTIPYYTYEMTLNEDSEEGSKNPFDDTFGSSKNPFDDTFGSSTNPFDDTFGSSTNPFDNIKSPFDNSRKQSDNSRNPFSSSKFRCKKCGKTFCACNKSFSKGVK